MMIDLDKVGQRIALLRKEKKLTGEKFAERLGVSPQAVSKWENGKCLPETALLPAIAALLGTSIDSILLPQELVVLDAKYTCGDQYIDVTDTVNRAVDGNKLRVAANCPIGGHSIERPAVFVLAVKYQTPTGTYYAFVPQNETLELDVSSKDLTAKDGFKIVGAYYGTGKEYKSVMQKMQHYDYFKWNEIHVNHETFPSSPGADESEYLTLVYRNSAGIHVVNCEENGVLRYTDDRTALVVKDMSTCMLPGVMVLEWGKNNTMPCTWAGALYAALNYMGESYTYEQIMGMSGACYRVVFCEVWDWSALDALVAFSYDTPLYAAIGYEPVWACRLEKDARITERRRIVADLQRGKPVVAINLRVAAEWGVITGYRNNGKTLYCRTYFDADKLNENKDYLETDNWPFLITHFGEKRKKPSAEAILIASLRALAKSFEASPRDGYFQGKQGYEKWMEGLKNDSIWDAQCPQNDLLRRFDVHLSTVYQLVDARRCAAAYLTECCSFVDLDVADLLMKMVASYRDFTGRLDTLKEGLLQKGAACFVDPSSGRSMRQKQAALLESALQDELQNVETAKQVITMMENKSNTNVRLSDETILDAVFGAVRHDGCIIGTVDRGNSNKSDGNTTTNITVFSPQNTLHLIEKTYGRNDAELHRVDIVRSYIDAIPKIYHIDFDKKTVLKEDVTRAYVPGHHFNDDNESGMFIRQNYQAILRAAAQWHIAFWENHSAFGQIGLDWRLETKENLLAHISEMEKDFRKYRKNEEAGKIPNVWEGKFSGTPFRFENHITLRQLEYFTDALERLKREYWELVEARFHAGKNITVIHGDMHPGTANVSKSAERSVKFDGLQAVRMGLPTEDLAMLIALHIAPDKRKAQPLLDHYYGCLCEGVKEYPHETFMNDYKIAVMENMFFPIRLIHRGIYAFNMRDSAIRAFETFVFEKK